MTIPDSVTTIGESAFFHCSSLTSITIPASVTTIGESAFDECDPLTNIIVPRNSYAEQYMKRYNLPYTYPDSTDWLNH